MAIKKATLRKRKASEDIEQDDNVPSQVSFSAEYTSPVGPATEIIGECDGFAKQAQSAIKRANVVISKLGQLLENSDNPDRWTVDDLKGSVDQVYNVDMYRTELMDWHEERMVPAGFTWDDRDEEDDNSNEQQPRARKKKAKKQSSEPRLPRDPLFQSVMRQAASLEMFNTHPDMYALLRKTRSSDHNTLNELRSSLSPPEPDDSSLSSLIYDITFQPLPRYVNKAMVPTRQLHLVALGSSTLWAIRNNAHVGGDNIPVGQRVTPDSSSQYQSHNQWNVPAGDVWEWQNVRRETGSCFVIEDAVYPDDRPDVQNYAQMLENSIDAAWSGDPAQKPKLTIGESMQQVKLGSLPLRIGQPYLFIHQGNSEHVFTIDSIRYIHPLDPPPDVYPMSTFMSRVLESKCKICDQDPGALYVFDDELAGQTPVLICEICFFELHGDNEQHQIKTAPHLAEF